MSQDPCTLFWPRSGFTPTPSADVAGAMAISAMPMAIVEPWLCSVTPRP